jgi:hypothetical protein
MAKLIQNAEKLTNHANKNAKTTKQKTARTVSAAAATKTMMTTCNYKLSIGVSIQCPINQITRRNACGYIAYSQKRAIQYSSMQESDHPSVYMRISKLSFRMLCNFRT